MFFFDLPALPPTPTRLGLGRWHTTGDSIDSSSIDTSSITAAIATGATATNTTASTTTTGTSTDTHNASSATAAAAATATDSSNPNTRATTATTTTTTATAAAAAAATTTTRAFAFSLSTQPPQRSGDPSTSLTRILQNVRVTEVKEGGADVLHARLFGTPLGGCGDADGGSSGGADIDVGDHDDDGGSSGVGGGASGVGGGLWGFGSAGGGALVPRDPAAGPREHLHILRGALCLCLDVLKDKDYNKDSTKHGGAHPTVATAATAAAAAAPASSFASSSSSSHHPADYMQLVDVLRVVRDDWEALCIERPQGGARSRNAGAFAAQDAKARAKGRAQRYGREWSDDVVDDEDDDDDPSAPERDLPFLPGDHVHRRSTDGGSSSSTGGGSTLAGTQAVVLDTTVGQALGSCRLLAVGFSAQESSAFEEKRYPRTFFTQEQCSDGDVELLRPQVRRAGNMCPSWCRLVLL